MSGALDKLTAKANQKAGIPANEQIKTEEKTKTKNTTETKVSRTKTKTADAGKEKAVAPVSKKNKTEVKAKTKETTGNKTGRTKSSDADKKKIEKISSTKKHPGGRKNTRGKLDEDYKMVNIAMPMDVYEKIKEASNGNMTYYINSVLRDSAEM